MFLTCLKIAEFLVLVAMVTSVQKTSASICSLKHDILTASNESLQSPNFPSHYPHNTTKVWRITAPEGERITLQFHTFALQSHSAQCGVRCGCDYVKVRNKCSDNTPVYTLCGPIIQPWMFTSVNNELWVEFRSDHSVNNTGFLALYTRASMSCPHPSDSPSKSDYCLQKDRVKCCDRNYVGCRYNKLLTNLNGTIETPGYPSDYPPNTNYRWRITVPQGYVVQINFTKFEIQGILQELRDGVLQTIGCAKCSCDKMRVLNGPCDFYEGKYACGRHSSLSYISKGRHMFVTFKSDGSVNGAGFKADYRIALPCKGLKPYSCVINGNPSCCSGVQAAVTCSDGHTLQRSHCKDGQSCCVVNGTATCCNKTGVTLECKSSQCNQGEVCCLRNGILGCCGPENPDDVKCTDRFTYKRSHCKKGRVCCIVNGFATCCAPLDAYVRCTDDGSAYRSHCPVNKKCCIVDTNKPMCCTGTRLGSWSLMIAVFAVMVLIGITS